MDCLRTPVNNLNFSVHCSGVYQFVSVFTFICYFFYYLFIYFIIYLFFYLQVTSYTEGYVLDGMVGYMRERTLVELR